MAFLLDRMGDPLAMFDDLMAMQSRFNRLFPVGETRGNGREYPPVKIWTGEDQVVVDVEAPGLETKDVDVAIEGATLTIRGKRSFQEETARGYHLRERFFGEFSRTLNLPFRAEADKVKAAYRNGVLRVHVPRAEADRPRRVELVSE